ncbi:MAG: ROK family protein [Firmicutes bacterium]|nr:ROK family protein [Bacillota bacterium]
MPDYLLGIDIGATNTRIAVVDTHGNIITSSHLPSHMAAGRSFFENVGQRAKELANKHDVRAIGVGSAGQLDRKTGTYLPGLYPDAAWTGVPLQEIIQQATNRPTVVDNDCKISAYAELKVGRGQGLEDFVSLTIGTGIGGGVIANGEIVHGEKGVAGHVGHISVEPGGLLCACGNRGCLELYASGTAVAKRATTLLQEEVTSPEVFKRASLGDKVCLGVIDEMAIALGRGLGAMANMLNPEVFILGGSILEWYPLLEKTLVHSFTQNVMKGLKNTPILRSELEGRGGVIGAALYAWDKMGR